MTKFTSNHIHAKCRLWEKAANDSGFELCDTELEPQGWMLKMASVAHPHKLCIRFKNGQLDRQHGETAWPKHKAWEAFLECDHDQAPNPASLEWLKNLACRPPQQQPVDRWSAEVEAELQRRHILSGTEGHAEIKTRIGQDIYKQGLMDLWGGCCALTGISIPLLLRASHAKPWAECTSDGERLDPYNGFLLAAHVDALFDRFAISFDVDGRILIRDDLPLDELERIGVVPGMQIQGIDERHKSYLNWHETRFKQS